MLEPSKETSASKIQDVLKIGQNKNVLDCDSKTFLNK